MKRYRIFCTLLGLCLTVGAFAQSSQSPTMQQSTSTVDTRQTNPVRPKIKRSTARQRARMEQGLDSTLPKDRPKRRLRPDSLRRGGATRVDTIRR